MDAFHKNQMPAKELLIIALLIRVARQYPIIHFHLLHRCIPVPPFLLSREPRFSFSGFLLFFAGLPLDLVPLRLLLFLMQLVDVVLEVVQIGA